MHRSPRIVRARAGLVAVAAPVVLVGCGAAVAGGGGTSVATEAEWRDLREPRPEPLPGSARVTLSGVRFLGAYPWPGDVGVDPGLGVGELVVANILRRRDVRFVERRRFAEAAAAERRGDPAPAGRPPAGVSESADYGLVAVWVPTAEREASLEIRLTALETGDVEGATRITVDRSAGPVAVARSIVSGALELLAARGRLPAWDDPLGGGPGAAANADGTSGVSMEALRHFLRGLAAEEAWRWEGARRGYQQALAVDPDFHEARTALARAARLRSGGTLAES